MNLGNLSVGLVVSNYKEMCKLLGENVKTGKSKIYQLKDWQCYFDYSKQGNAFVITELFSIPKPKIDERVKNSVYVKLIELMLMYELSQKKNFTCSYTKTYLFYLLGMVNEKYLRQKELEINLILKENKIGSWQFDNFCTRTQNKLTKVLFSALNSMVNRRLLDYEEQRVIIDYKQKLNYGSIEKNFRYATDVEKDIIQAVERKVLEQMYKEGEIKCKRVPISFFERNKYYERVSSLLMSQYGWKSHKEYKLIYHIEHLADGISNVKYEIKSILQKNQLELNEKIMVFLNNEAERLYIKNCNDFEEHKKELMLHFIGEVPNSVVNKNFFVYPKNYIEKQEKLTDLFINIDDMKDSSNSYNDTNQSFNETINSLFESIID